jgi:hypothetical protein
LDAEDGSVLQHGIAHAFFAATLADLFSVETD